jgi:sulfatase maturation enzyme AslB (radical SAM superfamily)
MGLLSYCIEKAGIEKAMRLLCAGPSLALTQSLATRLIESPPKWLWSKLGPALIRNIQRPSACCKPDSTHRRFVQRYFDLVAKPDGLEFAWRFLQSMDSIRAGQVLDAYLRMILFGILRHRLYGFAQKHTQHPAAILMELQLALYPECNLECKGCYSQEDRQGEVPSKKRILEIVDQAAACGAWAIHIVGKGEPFLSEHSTDKLLEVIAARPYLMFSISTNATFMTPALARRLSKLGNLLISVSIDGPEAIHDARRGAGTYKLAIRTLEILAEQQVLCAFTCMVSAQNFEAVTQPEFVEKLAKNRCMLGIYSRYFSLAPSHAAELTLSTQMRKQYIQRFSHLRADASIPLLDLEEVEEYTGCRSQAGLTVYVDGTTGRVAPCIRMPFAPASCSLERFTLGEILAQPYFVDYRNAAHGCVTCCGQSPDRELERLGRVLSTTDGQNRRLQAYLSRCRSPSPAAI